MKCNIKGTFIKALEIQQILNTFELCKRHLPETPKYFKVRLKNKHRCKEVEFCCYSYHMKTAKTGNEILVFKTNKAKTYIEYQYKEYNANEWFIMRMSPVYYRKELNYAIQHQQPPETHKKPPYNKGMHL